jgi:TolB-like protein/Tfp pilus assembly protein PilF
MASLIPDFEYDIFISYRQNDNKHDRWVTEFVNNLRAELESTFKEEISIYFDENPHDRLQETYNVSKSLEIKLRSFIFIPIVSQTYCDPKSYAWQHELVVFNRMAEADRFGRDIKLRNGNVASRILPVRIRDLDPEDVKLFEKETGSVLRPVDFVYKTASGVNRPLRSFEDNPNDNLNKTYYRDQVNKVAIAISEIFRSVNTGKTDSAAGKSKSDITSSETDQNRKPSDSQSVTTDHKSKKIIAVIISAVVFIAAVAAIFKITAHSRKMNSLSNLEKSIAILPFRNDSPNDTNTYFINGLMENVLNNLQMVKDLRVISRTSVEQYRNSTKSIPQIAKEQDVNYIVEGSGQKYGNSFTVNVQLIRAVKEDQLWAKSYEQEIKGISDIIGVQNKIARSIVMELKATITPEEKQLLEKIHTKSLNAYDLYQKGREDLMKFWVDNDDWTALKSARDLFRNALVYDSTFADAYASQALVYLNINIWKDMGSANYLDSVLIMADRALSYDDQLSEAYFAKGTYYTAKGLKNNALEEYDKAIKLNPNDWTAYYGKAMLYDDDPVQYLDNLQKALLINQSGVISPTILRNIGGKLEITGFKDRALHYYKKAFEMDGDSAFYLSCLGGAESDQGNYNKSVSYFKRAYNNRPNYTQVIERLGEDHLRLGQYKESLKYFKEYISLIPDFNPMVAYAYWQNGLKKEAENYFKEHLEFCNNALKSNPHSAWAYYDLACIYAFRGDKEGALRNLKLYSQNISCELWMLSHIKTDPFFKDIKNEPEYIQIVREMESSYQAVHDRVGDWVTKQRIQ